MSACPLGTKVGVSPELWGEVTSYSPTRGKEDYQNCGAASEKRLKLFGTNMIELAGIIRIADKINRNGYSLFPIA